MSQPRGERMVMMIGKPVHFRPNNRPVSACGIEFPEHSGYDGRYTNCIRCMKTKVWRVQLGKK